MLTFFLSGYFWYLIHRRTCTLIYSFWQKISFVSSAYFWFQSKYLSSTIEVLSSFQKNAKYPIFINLSETKDQLGFLCLLFRPWTFNVKMFKGTIMNLHETKLTIFWLYLLQIIFLPVVSYLVFLKKVKIIKYGLNELQKQTFFILQNTESELSMIFFGYKSFNITPFIQIIIIFNTFLKYFLG